MYSVLLYVCYVQSITSFDVCVGDILRISTICNSKGKYVFPDWLD